VWFGEMSTATMLISGILARAAVFSYISTVQRAGPRALHGAPVVRDGPEASQGAPATEALHPSAVTNHLADRNAADQPLNAREHTFNFSGGRPIIGERR
jgi:hypothetical protein